MPFSHFLPTCSSLSSIEARSAEEVGLESRKTCVLTPAAWAGPVTAHLQRVC